MRIATVLCVAAFAGCTKASDIFPVNGGAYEVIGESHTGLGNARQAAQEGETAYCARFHLSVATIGFVDHEASLSAASTLLFRCAH
jgi:hypothetical protein